MRRAAAAAISLVVWVGAADARPTRKVRIETEPTGAAVFVEDKENGSRCETPCSVELPVGESNLILELEGYNPKFTTVVVPKRGAAKIDALTLEKAIGTLIIEQPVGARVFLDDEDAGTVPFEQEVAAGAHTIVLETKGKKTVPAFVDVLSGEGKTFEPSLDVATRDPVKDTPDPTGDPALVEHPAPATARPAIVALSVIGDVGFRAFSYGGAAQSPEPLRGETEGGQVIFGPQLELWPGVLLKLRALRGLSLMGRIQFPVNTLTIQSMELAPTTTFWQSLEVSARHKWIVRRNLGVEIGAGYVRDQFQYNGTVTDKAKLPDATYSAVRIGARISYLKPISPTTSIEPFLGGELRLVPDGGALQGRFGAGSGVSGLRAGGGVLANVSKLRLRAELAILRYSWDLVPNNDRVADSATDRTVFVGFSLGYAY